MIDSVFFVDTKGRLLLGRNYSDHTADLDTLASTFQETFSGHDGPVFEHDHRHYIYTPKNSVIVVATTRVNANAVEIAVFLSKLIALIEHHVTRLEEESVKDNYVLVYELLDEVIDYGIIQMTDPKVMSQVSTQKAFQLTSIFEEKTARSSTSGVIADALSWRPEGVRHKKNEVYLDVIERVNLMAAADGEVISCGVVGEVVVKCYLSGMPELKLGLNERSMMVDGGGVNAGDTAVDLEDVRFHQCVQMGRFDEERVIYFTPPDGQFTLLTYRSSQLVDQRPLLWCECVVERDTSTCMELFVRVRSNFKRKSAANNVVISIPVPDDIDSPRFTATIGSARYKADEEAVVWKIGYFPGGGKEFSLRITVGRPIQRRTGSAEAVFGVKRPISIAFELPYFTLSGLQVRYLKIHERSGYQALPWVRYITRNGQYHIRMPDK